MSALIRFFKWLFRIKDKTAPVEQPAAPEDLREKMTIRRSVPERTLKGPFLVPTGRQKTKVEDAYLEKRTPKGGHFQLGNGGRLHRKNRDIIGRKGA